MASNGFSLLELQISFFLISIAVLGVARYQVFAQDQVSQGHYRGQALALMEEASRRIYLNSSNAHLYLTSDLANSSAASCSPCSPQDLVILDLSHLAENLKLVLPKAKARIHSCDGQVCMAVAWMDGSLNECSTSKSCIEREIF